MLTRPGVLGLDRECRTDQSTLLHLAARARRPRLVAACLAGGASANAKDARKRTPVHVAVRARASEMRIIELKFKNTVGNLKSHHLGRSRAV
jgi:hypothetical protein